MQRTGGMINLLRSQAKDYRFPFEFRDYSVKVPFESGWKDEVRNLISLSSAAIVAIGRNTHRSRAVNWEIREAYRQGKNGGRCAAAPQFAPAYPAGHGSGRSNHPLEYWTE